MALYFHLLKYLQTIIEENSRHSYFFPWSPGGLTRNDIYFILIQIQIAVSTATGSKIKQRVIAKGIPLKDKQEFPVAIFRFVIRRSIG